MKGDNNGNATQPLPYRAMALLVIIKSIIRGYNPVSASACKKASARSSDALQAYCLSEIGVVKH